MRPPLELRFWLALACLALAAPGTAAAQTPEPPEVHLDAPRYDAARGVYLLDFVYTRPEGIASLQVTAIDAQGVEVARLTFTPQGRNQSVELDATRLQAGQSYMLEVIGFSPTGQIISGGQGGSALASRQFTHLPGALQLGEPRFRIDPAAPELIIELAATGPANATAYRVVLAGQETNTVALDVQVPGPPPLHVPLAGLAAGRYQATILALDAAGAEVAQTSGELDYQTSQTQLGEPLFEYQAEPPALLVRLQPSGAEAAARYAVVLINPETNQVVADFDLPAGATTLTVPLDEVPGGTYLVQVRALDGAGNQLAATEGQTTYQPPAPPGALTRIARGLIAYPIIPVLIALIVLGLIGGLVLWAVWQRRATSTPLFQSWGMSQQAPGRLPVRAGLTEAGYGRPASLAGQVAELRLAVEATPDAGLAGRTIAVTRFPFTIGRGGCDLNIEGDARISTRHAELRLGGQGPSVLDLGSTNGTFVDGQRVPAGVAAPLRDGARLDVGKQTKMVVNLIVDRAG